MATQPFVAKPLQTASSQSPAIYSPLDPAERQIRILKVDKNLDDHGRIVGHLETVSLLRLHPEYEALSWVWGNSPRPTEMILDGFVLMIPRTADVVLRRLCLDQGHSCVWMDAVCINMLDESERNHQVTVMNDVYSLAKDVLIWLGEDDGFAESAIREIYLLATLFDKLQACWATQQLGDIPASTVKAWTSLERFYSSEWFTRLWTVQEWYMNERSICLYGHHPIDFRLVARAAAWQVRKHITLGYTLNTIRGMVVTANAYTALELSSDLDLNNLLGLCAGLDATNPLDHVYGLFGVMRSAIRGFAAVAPHPDYSKSELDVYREITRVMLEIPNEACPLEFLNQSQAQALHPDETWPSWVYSRRAAWSSAHFLLPQPFFGADGDEKLVYLPNVGDKDVLAVQGVHVTRIRRFVASSNFECTKPEVDEIASTVLKWERFAKMGPTQLAEDEREQMFASILTAGTNPRNDEGIEERDLVDFIMLHRAFIRECHSRVEGPLIADQTIDEPRDEQTTTVLNLYPRIVEKYMTNQALFLTEHGVLGLGPSTMRENDVVCILFGYTLPVVLRPHDGHHRLIGDAYVPGYMKGEFIDELRRADKLEKQRTTIHIR